MSQFWFPLGKTRTDLGSSCTVANSARSAPGPDGSGVGEQGWRVGWRVTGAAALRRLGETSPAGPDSFEGDLAPLPTSGDDSVDQSGSPPPRHGRQARGMGVRASLPSKSKLQRNTPPAVLARLHRLPDRPLHSGTELQGRPSPPPLQGAATKLRCCCPRQGPEGQASLTISFLR